MKKYEFTGETQEFNGCTLRRIRALRDFECQGFSVKAGDLGGWIEKEENLSLEDTCWISGEARVFGKARVSGEAWISGKARVYGEARVSGEARVYGKAWIFGEARVSGEAWIFGKARVSGEAWAYETTDFLAIGPIGSRDAVTTFYRLKSGSIGVTCGCFTGTIDEFAAKVQSTHGSNHHAAVYHAAIEFAKVHFSKEVTI